MIERYLSEDPVDGIPEPFKSKPIEEMTKTSPRDEVSSTLVPSIDQPFAAAIAAQPSSSLVYIRDFSTIDDVVNL